MVTVTSTVPTLPAGAVAVIWVSESIVYELAAVKSKLTAVAPVQFAFRDLPILVVEGMAAIDSGQFLGALPARLGGGNAHARGVMNDLRLSRFHRAHKLQVGPSVG